MADSTKRAEIKRDTTQGDAMPVLEDTKEKTSIKNNIWTKVQHKKRVRQL
jgi:hypothetical protein